MNCAMNNFMFFFYDIEIRCKLLTFLSERKSPDEIKNVTHHVFETDEVSHARFT